MSSYFEQNALAIPAETIANKVEMRDFTFFLEQDNFFKVVDSLERFQSDAVDRQSQAGRDFVLFKRQLYQMYEVQNRSAVEHEKFSTLVERRNLKWLSQASKDYQMELVQINEIDQLEDTAGLKGKVFKQKVMNPRRLKGVGAFALSYIAYNNMGALSMLVGTTLPMFALTASLLYGMKAFNERNVIDSIEWLDNGQLRINVTQSPFVTTAYTTSARNVRSICSLGEDDMGADDTDSNLIEVLEYTDSAGNTGRNAVFTLPSDAMRDRELMEWIMAPKHADETLADDFTDLIRHNFEQRRLQGGNPNLLGMLERKPDLQIEESSKTDDYLRQLQVIYGQEALAKMSPSELYRLYKRHVRVEA